MQTNPDYEMHLRPEEDYEMHFDDAGLKPEQTATVTPTYEEQTVKPDPGCVFSEVKVEAITEPTEKIDITENGVVNVARYGTANVAVPVGVFPEGTKVITQNVTGEDVTNYEKVDVAVPGPSGTKQISITRNGTTTEDVSEYADVEITVNTLPAKGLVFEDYDADGYPRSARFVGSWQIIPADYLAGNAEGGFYYAIKGTIVLPDDTTEIMRAAFSATPMEYIILPDNDLIINEQVFYENARIKELIFKL